MPFQFFSSKKTPRKQRFPGCRRYSIYALLKLLFCNEALVNTDFSSNSDQIIPIG